MEKQIANLERVTEEEAIGAQGQKGSSANYRKSKEKRADL